MKGDSSTKVKPGYQRETVLVILSIGALLSLTKTFQAGRNNSSILLVTLFLIWVLSPFVTLFIANLKATKKPFRIQMIIYIISVVITLGSVMAYTGLWTAPGSKKAFVFLITPFLSWLLMIISFILVSLVHPPRLPQLDEITTNAPD